jgi:hypothetical protein
MIPNAFFQNYVVYAANGSVDVKKSLKKFEDDFNAWCKEQIELKPAILEELRTYKRLGEQKLVAFTMRSLSLQPNKENTDRIQNALQELQRAGQIMYKTTESGARRGRGAGWMLREDAKSARAVA